MADLLKRLQLSKKQYGVGMEENPFADKSSSECMILNFGGGGSPPPPPPSTVTQQTSNIPEYFQPYLERLFERAEGVTTEPFEQYEGPRLAAPTTQQQAAYQGVEDMVGGYKPYIQTADLLTAQAAQQSTDPQAIASRMSPYQQSVIDIQKREALRDTEKLQQQLGASAVGAGAYGGSRQALLESELGRQTGQRLADIQATGSQQAYQQAANQLQTDRAASLASGQQFAGLGAQQQQLGLAGMGALETIGGTQQAQQQRAFDIAYEDFARERTMPSQQVQELSSVLRGFNLPVSTYATTQQNLAPPSFAQQAAGLGLGALGVYGAGKGVGLFAEGGSVPDNPGIKKLAEKAPEVVENMGYDPNEVIAAYMGGQMNFDEGGDTGNSISNFLSEYGTEASAAAGLAPFLYMGAKKFTTPYRFVRNEIKRIKDMKGLTESERKMRIEKMIRDNRKAIGADKQIGDLMVFGRPLRDIGKDIVGKGKDIVSSIRGDKNTQRVIDEAVYNRLKPTSRQTIKLPVPVGTKPGVFAPRGGPQTQINKLPAVVTNRPSGMSGGEAFLRTPENLIAGALDVEQDEVPPATKEEITNFDLDEVVKNTELSAFEELLAKARAGKGEEGVNIGQATQGLLQLVQGEDIRMGNQSMQDAIKGIGERQLQQDILSTKKDDREFDELATIAGLDLKQQEIVANKQVALEKLLLDTYKVRADKISDYIKAIPPRAFLDPSGGILEQVIAQILEAEGQFTTGKGESIVSDNAKNSGMKSKTNVPLVIDTTGGSG